MFDIIYHVSQYLDFNDYLNVVSEFPEIFSTKIFIKLAEKTDKEEILFSLKEHVDLILKKKINFNKILYNIFQMYNFVLNDQEKNCVFEKYDVFKERNLYNILKDIIIDNENIVDCINKDIFHKIVFFKQEINLWKDINQHIYDILYF